MNQQFHQVNLNLIKFQRNVFLGLSFLLAISLVIVACFLFWKSERIIVVPPVVEKEFWIDVNKVSATYLEQLGYFLGELVLTKSDKSASSQRTILLRHTDPSYVGILHKKLLEEEKILSEQGASYVFFPIDIRVNEKALEVLLIGDRNLYTYGKLISTVREGYVFAFSNEGARLLLKEIRSEEIK